MPLPDSFFERLEPEQFSLRDHLAGLLSWRGLLVGTLGVCAWTVLSIVAVLFYSGVIMP